MAFSVTLYYNTYGIKTSGWMTYAPTSLDFEFTHPTNDVSVNWNYTHPGLPDGTNVYFSCTVKSGFTFKYWKYYVGGSSVAQYWYDQDFKYTDGKDVIVYVYAESESGGDGGDSGDWTIQDEGSDSFLYGHMNIDLEFGEYHICRYAVSFAYSGTAIFYTTGRDTDTYGFLTSSKSSIDADGNPRSDDILAEADSYESDFDGDDGYNFSITYPVKAGTTYYIWVREFFGYEGNCVLRIISPEESGSELWSWSDTAYNAFLNNGNTEDVPYTEWNEFVNFVAKKTGYSVSSALMSASDTKLYATKFNAVRYAIGSVNTFKNGTNSIKEHYEETGQWDMASGEVVKGQYFIDLTEYLNDIT